MMQRGGNFECKNLDNAEPDNEVLKYTGYITAFAQTEGLPQIIHWYAWI